ncbi:recombinase family protein [Brevundimonas sp. NIBR11]|uniref:recombinase family protein n=1 Tax=Brevundimonas sp. NIBR11 TaxID=3015999 RepID=UPI0022EFE868|nr:recombinase family protein [Brevundimonas sp. NIBR11]WGM30611.1 hypothetical protein KKHFBJBL_00836 [Brevundimonas sp. NIBR11]
MTTKPAKLRCAVYTRKSSDEGLDQAFNSLHAQREACEAYVKSQAGEGWVLLPTLYDDGGLSGGTMERPALKQLLADIEHGIVDIVVVYKVDRLTRSLMDFARIVERFDQHQVSFVSVTQAFNTTNSMGRLTLNVLLSFAQFEREVTGERIRDKIAASKAKGMWMGGTPPLGYAPPIDPTTRALVVIPDDADRVRDLFERYVALGSVHALKQELDAAGEMTRVHVSRNGNARGGAAWGRGALFHLLRNRVYRGEIVHGSKTYPGAHPAIIAQELFDRVQASLDANGAERRDRAVKPGGSPLTGLIQDADGLPMTPAIAYGKLGRKYRYYVSRPLQEGRASSLDRSQVRRVPAGAIEDWVIDALTGAGLVADEATWSDNRERLVSVRLHQDRITITARAHDLDAAAISFAQSRLGPDQVMRIKPGKVRLIEMDLLRRPQFRGGRTWATSKAGGSVGHSTQGEDAMLTKLRRAHAIVNRHGASPLATSFDEARGIDDSFERRIAALAFLAPDVQKAIAEGQTPIDLTKAQLQSLRLPLSWSEQRKMLGLASHAD